MKYVELLIIRSKSIEVNAFQFFLNYEHLKCRNLRNAYICITIYP